MSNNMGREECIIQVNEEKWVRQMEDEFEEVKRKPEEEFNRWKAMSIYRIPWSLKNLSQESYQPQMVAIGPYHHGAEQLKDMEEHKKRALRIFLYRSKKPLHEYVNALTPILQDLKNAYQQLQPADDFLKMMVLDGCFLLELLRTQGQGRTSTEQKPTSTEQEPTSTDMKVDTSIYKSDDPVFSKHGHIYCGPHLKRDMLMLENQIPLQLLIKLVEVEGLWKEDNLTKSILVFFERDGEISKIDKRKFENCLHILDLYRRSLLSFKNEDSFENKEMKPSYGWKERLRKMLRISSDKKKKKKKNKRDGMRSATDLDEAGIHFKIAESAYMDQISFSGGKVMLPPIVVDDATKTIYLNMMAFERFDVNRWDNEKYKEGNHVTSYVYFMDRLIDTAKDVSLLHKRHILKYSVSSDQSVAELFNTLSTDLCLDSKNRLKKVKETVETVTEYLQKPVPACIAYANHNYFPNPWVTLSVVAAIFLFALTITQTVYAVLDYHKP